MAAIITVKGKEYTLGDIAYTDENIDLFDELMNLDESDGKLPTTLMKGMRRLLQEALEDGCGKELAAEAMAGIRFSFAKNSDFTRAIGALTAQLKGE